MSMSGRARPEVVLVRHGETGWTRAGRHTSRTDIPLDDAGRRQARLLGPPLAGRSFVAVLTSPLRRVADTCALAGCGEAARQCDDLREWDYGDYEGRTTADIRRQVPNWTVWTHDSPGGESAEEVGRRADRVIAALRREPGDTAVFGHGHMLRVLAARWCGLPPIDGRLLALDPATVSVLGYERDTAVIRSWNQPVAASTAGTPWCSGLRGRSRRS